MNNSQFEALTVASSRPAAFCATSYLTEEQPEPQRYPNSLKVAHREKDGAWPLSHLCQTSESHVLPPGLCLDIAQFKDLTDC